MSPYTHVRATTLRLSYAATFFDKGFTADVAVNLYRDPATRLIHVTQTLQNRAFTVMPKDTPEVSGFPIMLVTPHDLAKHTHGYTPDHIRRLELAAEKHARQLARAARKAAA
jgi:hypothetical protein